MNLCPPSSKDVHCSSRQFLGSHVKEALPHSPVVGIVRTGKALVCQAGEVSHPIP